MSRVFLRIIYSPETQIKNSYYDYYNTDNIKSYYYKSKHAHYVMLEDQLCKFFINILKLKHRRMIVTLYNNIKSFNEFINFIIINFYKDPYLYDIIDSCIEDGVINASMNLVTKHISCPKVVLEKR